MAPIGVLIAMLSANVPANVSAREVALRAVAEDVKNPSPLLLLVSIRKQRIRVFDNSGEVTSSRISSGQPGFDTPTGVFSILEKNVVHESNIYDGAPMPFMQRLTWSGIALHAGVVPGYRASHGCIRLPGSFAKTLFSLTKTGNRVVVANDEVAPVHFDHPNLFRPLPGTTPSMTSGENYRQTETKVAANETNVTASDTLPDLTSPDDDSKMTAMPGVSPEMIPEPDDPIDEDLKKIFGNKNKPRPRTRIEAEKMTIDRVANLQGELKTAEARVERAASNVKTVLKETDAAMATLSAERKAIDALRASLTAVERKQSDALRAFETYFKGKPASRNEDRELELEDAVLDATIDADQARTDAARKEMAFAEVQTSLAKAETARTAATTEVTESAVALKMMKAELAEAKKDVERSGKPISVFISLKSRKIFVRQGFEPVFDAPVQVDPVGGPIGTHVFTAMRYGKDDSSFEWKLVSAFIPADGTADQSKKNRKRDDEGRPPARSGADLATVALDAIDIPDQARQMIMERARPGASLIISDRDLPRNENGKGTEFVVLTR